MPGSSEIATTEAPFGAAQLERLHHVTGGTLAPDGERVAVSVRWRDGDEERTVVRIVDVARDAIVATLDDRTVHGAPAWSPDGTLLAYVAVHDGAPQLYVAGREGGDVRRLTDAPRGVAGIPLWSPDGRRVALSALVGTAVDPTAPRRIERAIWRVDGLGLVQDHLMHVLAVDVATGATTPLTDGDGLALPLAWSPDGRRLLLAVNLRPSAAAGDALEDLYEVELDGGAARRLPAHRAMVTVAGYLPDGRVAYTHLLDGERQPGARSHLWVLEPDGSRTCRSAELADDIIATDPSDGLVVPRGLLLDASDAIVCTQRGSAFGIHRVPLAEPGPAEAIVEDPARCCYPLELRGGRLLCASSSMTAPTTLVLVDLATGAERTVAALADEERTQFRRPRVERGFGPCDMWLLHPTTGVEPPYATVLLVHGGPYWAYGEFFEPTAQLLAGAGFAVLMGNPPGSRGYGEEHGFATYRDWGGLDGKALLSAVDEAVDRGLADPHRLGVSGLSYGGYMTCWLAATTTVFAAAVAENPVTDLLSQEGTSDVGPWLVGSYYGDERAELEEGCWRASPVTYARECTTPTLLVLGGEDHRCPSTQGFQFHTALRSVGCVAELLLLPGASHMGAVNGPLPGRRAQEAALVEWFSRYLDGSVAA